MLGFYILYCAKCYIRFMYFGCMTYVFQEYGTYVFGNYGAYHVCNVGGLSKAYGCMLVMLCVFFEWFHFYYHY